MTELLSAILGAILAALLAFRFGRSKDERDQKRQAYLSFVQAVSALGHNDPTGAKKLTEANLAVVLTGCGEVVRAVDFLMQHKQLDNYDAQAAFATAVIEMRRDLGLHQIKSDNAMIRGILFRDPIL